MTDHTRPRPMWFWPEDFWHDPRVLRLGPGEAVVYAAMLTLAWMQAPHVGFPALLADAQAVAHDLRLGRNGARIVLRICAEDAGLWQYTTVDGIRYWINPRQIEDWQRATASAEKRHNRAISGASARWRNDASSMPQASQEQCSDDACNRPFLFSLFSSPSPSSPIDPALVEDPTSPVGSTTHTSKTAEAANSEPEAAPAPDGASGPTGRARPPGPQGADLIALWNPLAAQAGLPQLRAWTPERERHLRARSRDRPERADPAWWAAVFRRVADSPFLTGHGPRGWRADLDWLLRSETHLTRVLEGAYDARPAPAGEPAGWAGLRDYAREVFADDQS